VEVLKWVTLVRLLLGEIPERSSLEQAGMQQSMLPYLDITQAVRVGDMGLFKAAVEKFHGVFVADKTLNLIGRLRRNVIRTGLRRINLAYR
jgi:26S proteasome regulatory subunit N3